MNNVLRVLGIVAVSMVMSVTALFLILFTICGGFAGSGNSAGLVVVVTAAIFAGGVALIVFLGRGLKASRGPGAPGNLGLGLAVPPAGAAPAPYYAPAAVVQRPAVLRTPTAQDVLLLNVLRAALGVLAFLPIVMAAVSFARFQHISAGLGIQVAVQGVLNALPPAIMLVVLMLRTPPPGVGLDVTAGMAIASIVYRALFFTYTMWAWPGYSLANNLPTLFLRLGLFTLLEVAIGVLALVVRNRTGQVNPGAVILAVFGFLFWEAILQAAMTAMVRLLY